MQNARPQVNAAASAHSHYTTAFYAHPRVRSASRLPFTTTEGACPGLLYPQSKVRRPLLPWDGRAYKSQPFFPTARSHRSTAAHRGEGRGARLLPLTYSCFTLSLETPGEKSIFFFFTMGLIQSSATWLDPHDSGAQELHITTPVWCGAINAFPCWRQGSASPLEQFQARLIESLALCRGWVYFACFWPDSTPVLSRNETISFEKMLLCHWKDNRHQRLTL